MPTIEKFADAVASVAPGIRAAELLNRFRSEPELQHLPVVDGERVVGLIERSACLVQLIDAAPDTLTAADVMDPEPVVVDCGIHAGTLSEILLKGGSVALVRGFVVTRGGAYHGVGSPVALLRAIAHQNSKASGDASTGPDARRLIAAACQELRGSISGVMAGADLLRRHPLSPAALTQVQSVVDSAQSMFDILQDAVDLSAGDEPLAQAVQPTPLRALMDEIDHSWTERATQNGLTLLVSYEGDTELSADIDPARLRRVFDNLIAQALKFAREGMIEAQLKAQLVGTTIHISALVRDEAAAAGRPDLTTTFKSDTMEAGFGLAVCRQIVNGMGGRIWGRSNAGRGATVHFTLEAPKSAPAVVEVEDNVQALRDLELGSSPHILIVDDNATNRVVAQALCEMFGCSCETAEDGVEAVEAVQSRAFDLILMDIKMPRMDGVQATRAIRAMDGPAGRIPIIALTANADPADVLSYIESGMAAVVEKPIKPERLRMAMNAGLNAQEQAAAPATTRTRGAQVA